MNLVAIRSVGELRSLAMAWDDLWRRSEVRSPLARAETVASWIERFAPAARFECLAVEAEGKLAAALPLVGRRLRNLVEIGGLPANSWALCGDLLVDAATDVDAAMDALVAGIAKLDWPAVWLEPVAYESPRWQAFVAAVRRRGLAVAPLFVDVVGQVDVQGSWSSYQERWTRNHRRHIRKADRRATTTGRLSLEVCTAFEPGRVADLLRRGCDIENRSWKGEAGTSILRAPGMFDWFVKQAEQLADWGQLQLTFLQLDGRPIAFEYGYRAKATYFSHKVGYDPAYAHLSPGQLLRQRMLERFFAERQVRCVDFWGPLSDATAKWATHCYRVGRLVVAPDRLFSQLAVRGYRTLRPWLRTRQPARPIAKLANSLSPLDSSQCCTAGDNK